MRLEGEMNKSFRYSVTAGSARWIEDLRQTQDIMTLCSLELCSWLNFWNLDTLGDSFRLLYHLHKTHINCLLEGYMVFIEKLGIGKEKIFFTQDDNLGPQSSLGEKNFANLFCRISRESNCAKKSQRQFDDSESF